MISDILGKSGRAMLEAIAAGETDPDKLARLAHPRLKATPENLKAALCGRIKDHHRLMLRIFLDGNTLLVEPRVPEDWKSFRIKYTLNENVYTIEVTQTNRQFTLRVNGLPITGQRIGLHQVVSEPVHQ